MTTPAAELQPAAPATGSLSPDEHNAILRVYAALASRIPGFRPTRQQRRMIEVGAQALSGGSIALIEAPTGVGKTVGYLVPGIVLAQMRGKRLIVSTATAALQDQVASKDIHAVSTAMTEAGMTEPIRTVAKGRERYVCALKLHNQAVMPDLFSTAQQSKLVDHMRERFDASLWNGDRDGLAEVPDEALWRAVSSTRHSCLGRRCSEANECAYFASATRAESATVVIANHDLVLTSLACTERSIFADFESNLFVFDEGHHLAEKALGAFASRASTSTDWSRDLPGLLARAGVGQFKHAADAELTRLRSVLRSLSVSFGQLAGQEQRYRFAMGQTPDHIRAGATQAKEILSRLSEFATRALSANKTETLRVPLGSVFGAIETSADGWSAFCVNDTAKPHARWIERANEHWVAITSPFDAAPFLRSMLWRACKGAIVTSATLAPLGSFQATSASLGLPRQESTVQAKLDSPFDYRRACLRIPKMNAMPSDVSRHTSEVARKLKVIAASAGGGVLVLFASAKQMRDVHELVGEALRQHILVQGQLPVREIIARHTAAISGEQRSIIFGLASFAEGIDLPGALCTRVVIAKLPFPAPDEPLVAAASEWVQQQGGNAFAAVSLPRGATRFAQQVGRLIRSASDWGEVIVLDRRLAQKSYGRRMLSPVAMRVVVV